MMFSCVDSDGSHTSTRLGPHATSVHVFLLCIGRPSPPISPQQSNMSCTCVNITWDTPLFDGAAPLDTISITYTSTSNASQVRTIRTDTGTGTELEICDLVPNEVYNASIVALNRVGPSEEVVFPIVIRASGEACEVS